MIHETDVLQSENLSSVFAELQEVIFRAVRDGQAVHEVEKAVWEQVLLIGRQALGQFFALSGSGDLGATVTLPTGAEYQRLEELHERRYVSIFGEFWLRRVVYGRREKEKIEFVPLDNRWQLPECVFSYVLQDWDQSLCVEEAFGKSASRRDQGSDSRRAYRCL
jgi:hypothetical protein